MGISNRGTKAKTITSSDNAFVTNIGAAAASLALRFRAKNICWPETLQRSEAAHRTPPGKRPVGTEINPLLWGCPLLRQRHFDT
ncbi:hypothetical protein ACQKNB_14485 [Lysinibacillus xylanilyticus]|uniref:hypothetical protein n=1 Tax=Lysinibacillus xylanilyticus TaxID=582475 RepID=UPI003D06270A